MFYKDSAVVIGNGESRLSIDLRQLKNTVTLIGCNAIHRDIDVDHLICCDRRMVNETLARKKSKRILNIYTRQRSFTDFYKLHKNQRVKLVPPLPYEGPHKADQPEHWGSGPYAILLAASMGFKNVLLVGFDLYGKRHLVNNVYKNTTNYLSEDKPAVDPNYWIYQIRKIFMLYPNTKFKIFNTLEWSLPDDWHLPNVEFFDLNKFSLELAKEVNIVYNNSIEA